MNNKKIPTCLGTAILVVIAITAGVFVWIYEKNQGPITIDTTIQIVKKSTNPKKSTVEPTKDTNNCLEQTGQRICKDKSLVAMFDEKCTPSVCTDKTKINYYSPYFKDESKIYLENQIPGQVPFPVTGSDVTTFRYLGPCASVEMSTAYYGADKNHIYLNNEPLTDIDTASFQYLGVFGNGEGMPHSISISEDKNHVYFGCGTVIPSVDRRSFTILDNGYSKDTYHAYYLDSIIPDADAATIEPISYAPESKLYGNFAADKNHVFFEGNILNNVNPSTCKSNDLAACLPKNWHDLIEHRDESKKLPDGIY